MRGGRMSRPWMAVSAVWALAALSGCGRAPAEPRVSAPDGLDNVPPARAAQLPPTGAPALTYPVSKDPVKPELARTPAAPAKELADVLEYVGAFRVPKGNLGDSTFDYGGTAMAFNAANNSLFI